MQANNAATYILTNQTPINFTIFQLWIKYLRKLKLRFDKTYKKYFKDDLPNIIKKFNIDYKFNAQEMMDCSNRDLNSKLKRIKS